MNLTHRPRRLRRTASVRKLVRETKLTAADLIYPLFVVHGIEIKEEISSLPGNYHLSLDLLLEEIADLVKLGIGGIILFGIPQIKDQLGSGAWDQEEIVQQACRQIKEEYPDLLVITDVCLCQYTSHGHCGAIKNGYVQNDITLENLAKTALSHAKAGADMVAPSDMMDGRVKAIRERLDQEGYQDTAIMAYSAKYSSAFYGPFREAAHSAPQEGDRSSYQMDPANSDEALREIKLDLEEGADIVMVKPALPYLDIIRRAKDQFNTPLAAYNVSGEYAMIKAAAQKGWLDEEKTALESLTSIKRAGAEIIITYWAKDIAKKLAKDN
ncbi:delta-aminolevulinic acid dehydratase [Halobacteroides halobius DSM 5150]|uniref:Delta-aminolevulinic acid dehydratase n=1 Tax=Halobacteroides halobius (strain ATCC 35273 / DSM 5150 / MD-1) TaxID=748449 RepID=L0KA01_HALHC|nr:porphobilinogen synthase [Halobacteroides halobius]AGB41204.1 delta-aminolevulinic acid dehydratase [Halobacteroides halobius DSM 5150]